MFFTCICYLSIGLPLAVLPGYIHYQLGYSTFVAGIVISLQYISTLISRPHAGRYTDIWGPKKVVSLGIVCCLLSGAFTLLAVVLQATPMLAIAALLAGRVFLGVGESFTATGATLWGIKTVGAITRHGLSPGTAWRPMWRWRSGRRWELPSITILASAALLRW
ncbi:transporter [Klebsiella pneumoniae]|uniref:Transporter n=1 Tax=Klebsiella pneumoniae TaxID=573 RepID=A0A377TSK6_KLEPN|nr:transporter [Klebsiella pneumoniae]